MSEEQELNFFQEEAPDHHFRTEIPNCIIDAGLSPYEISVYLYIKRIAGDASRCWKSKKAIALALGISERKVTYALENLCTTNNKFKIPLLRCYKRKKADGSPDTNIYTVINIWAFNGNFYRHGVVHQMHQGGAPGADKEEPSQELPIPSINTEPLNVCARETQKKKTTNGSAQKQYKRPDRHIPEFLNNPRIPREEQQKLANQFCEADLYQALLESVSYNKNIEPIENIPAFITAKCHKFIKKRKEKHGK